MLTGPETTTYSLFLQSKIDKGKYVGVKNLDFLNYLCLHYFQVN